mmetsp:Transcript_14320/g.18711  ORF Transcript_14320/g.18711 Transcript_14320/m.18711 type:complete len:363 (+) Transcript_14320:74-1162(+)
MEWGRMAKAGRKYWLEKDKENCEPPPSKRRCRPNPRRITLSPIDNSSSLQQAQQESGSPVQQSPTSDSLFSKKDHCHGLSFSFLDSTTRKDSDSLRLREGFLSRISQAMHLCVSAAKYNLQYPLDDRRFPGVIDNARTKQVSMVLQNNFCFDNKVDIRTIPFVDRYGFVSVDCVGQKGDEGPCKNCCVQSRDFLQKCRRAHDSNKLLESGNLHGSRINLAWSPTILQTRCRIQAEQLNAQRKKIFKLSFLIKKFKQQLKQSQPGDISDELKSQLKVKHQADIYDGDVKNAYLNVFANETTDQQQLAKALFEEQLYQAQLSKKIGKKACRYSNALMMFCIQLRVKLGSGRYGFLAKVTGMPSD